jgi:small-conductance mechanosensitive channel
VGGKVYAVGDRIQIAGHRGVVLDHEVFTTKLLEIGRDSSFQFAGSPSSPEPRITIQLLEPGKAQFVLRFPAPDRGRSRVEQAIVRRYLDEVTKS